MFIYPLFFLPAFWLAYVCGLVLREGIAALLYYRMADLTPWLLGHWDGLVVAAVALLVVGNLMWMVKVHYFMWRRVVWAFPVVFGGGVLWLLACLLRPDWWLAPMGGLFVFTLVTGGLLVAVLARCALRHDELLSVLAWLGGWTLVTAGLHMLVTAWLG